MAGALMVQPDREFIREVAQNSGGDLKKCFQCATCVSVCSLSTEENPFPRRQILMAQWGMKDELMADPGPWLCFYCGECSKICPRQANPGENMMVLRRYLTARYDWTGLGRRMYRSAAWEIGALVLVAALTGLLFVLPWNFGFGLLRHAGPQALSTVMLDKFAPVETVHLGDIVLASLLGFLLLTNAARMFFCVTRGKQIPFRLYFTELPQLIVQTLFQSRWGACLERESVKNWSRHLLLVTGYVTMFSLVVLFLPWFQVQNSSIRWTSNLGYYATTVLLFTTVWILWDRIKKRSEMHRFSHLSDWLFPILLFLTALSGILVHIFRIMDLPMATYVAYAIHLMISVSMLVVEVPFGKWSHLLYRPLAIYLAGVIQKSRKISPAGAVPAGLARVGNQEFIRPDLIIF